MSQSSCVGVFVFKLSSWLDSHPLFHEMSLLSPAKKTLLGENTLYPTIEPNYLIVAAQVFCIIVMVSQLLEQHFSPTSLLKVVLHILWPPRLFRGFLDFISPNFFFVFFLFCSAQKLLLNYSTACWIISELLCHHVVYSVYRGP